MMKVNKLTLLIILVLNVSLSCTKNYFPEKKNVKFLDKWYLNNVFLIYYDNLTQKQFPNRREAILSTLKNVFERKPYLIIIKYFLSSTSLTQSMQLESFIKKYNIKNLYLQMGKWDNNVYNGNMLNIEKYGNIHWIIPTKNLVNSKYTMEMDKIIFPDKCFLKSENFIGHVNGYIKKDGDIKEFYGIPLFVKWKKYLIPSLSLLIALKIEGYNIHDIKIKKQNEHYEIKQINIFV